MKQKHNLLRIGLHAASLALATWGFVNAATAAPVTLKSFDGSFEASGELESSEGNFYAIRTDIGSLKVRKEFVECIGADCPEAAPAAPDLASAEIELASLDGTARFIGNLLNFDGNEFELQTSLGVLKIKSALVDCTGEACPEQTQRFTIALPGETGAGLVTRALDRYAQSQSLTVTASFNPDGSSTHLVARDDGSLVAEVSLVNASSLDAFSMVKSGEASVALTRIPAKPQDLARLFDVPEPQARALLSVKTVALDAIVPLMHPSNATLQLSLRTIADILAGNITDWSQISSRSGPIKLYGLNESHELTSFLASELLAPLRLRPAAATEILSSSQDISRKIASDPNGFALAFRSETSDIHSPSVRSACGIVSSSDPFQLQSEEYPMTLRWHLNSLSSADLPEFAAGFSEFLLTDEGQQFARRSGLVGLAVESVPMQQQGDRLLSAVAATGAGSVDFRVLKSYLSQVSSGVRLSTTLRFLAGSTQFDLRAERDLERIADLVKGDGLLGRKLVLVGFSDAIGGFGRNIALSQARAERAKFDLLAANAGLIDPADIETLGFGPVAPVGCNELVAGRDKNRRVEVWLR